MMAAADDYFELFTQKQPQRVSSIPYSKICDRWENGMQTTKAEQIRG